MRNIGQWSTHFTRECLPVTVYPARLQSELRVQHPLEAPSTTHFAVGVPYHYICSIVIAAAAAEAASLFTMLAVFLVAVLVLGTFPTGAVLVDFRATLESGGAPDVSSDLLCVKGRHGDGVDIHLPSHRVGGDRPRGRHERARTLLVDEDPPFEFTVREDDLNEVVGEKQFTVRLLDDDGTLIRQYTRRLAMIPEG